MDKKLENKYFRLKKDLQKEQAKNKKLRTELSALKEKIKGMKPTKSGERIKALQDAIAAMEKISDDLRDRIYILEQEKKQMLQSKGMISPSEHEGLLKQLEHERQSKEQYQCLYEQEKAKRNELKKKFKTENENKIVIYPTAEENEKLVVRIKELEAKLSRKGTGKPRNNNTSDEEVLKLRNEGNTIRKICSITGMSTATVIKVLKSVKSI